MAQQRASSVSIDRGFSFQTKVGGSFASFGFSAGASFAYNYNRDTESSSETNIFQVSQGEILQARVRYTCILMQTLILRYNYHLKRTL